MKKIKDILTNVIYGMLRSYEGKRFLPSLIAKLAISLASAVVTAFFADTLFSLCGIFLLRSGRDGAGLCVGEFFIPFDLNNVKLFYDGAVMCRLTEMYIDESENLNLTLYVSNGTEQDVRLTGVNITVSDGERQLLDRHFDIDMSVGAGDVSLYGLMVYSDELDFTT